MAGNAVYILERKLDPTAARAMLSGLMEHRGKPLDIDASQVTHVGALAVEVLLSAGQQWQSDGQPIRIVSPTQVMDDVFRTLGLDPVALAAADLTNERQPT